MWHRDSRSGAARIADNDEYLMTTAKRLETTHVRFSAVYSVCLIPHLSFLRR
jgi:hypothetical protein